LNKPRKDHLWEKCRKSPNLGESEEVVLKKEKRRVVSGRRNGDTSSRRGRGEKQFF